ncbi:Presilphiperfolan-8-beta-ol synthase [Penicillium alfredii]|uniref:Terpene synthase n=1 Tax=Penicillium alfredii TaxID=1506179 RepID=A0A9W9KG14_9EURO|nr:Presilphiperfolan-8-beta-ol synthase [Penicillium alfredii]KAJ5104431.1 Presilphiperfolan-8-beta-ol synthase [Penicillium alfredii]
MALVSPIQPPAQSSSEHLVYLPDLFSSIMAVKPTLSPHYHDAKAEADSWIQRTLHADDNWAAKNSRVNFAYMSSIWAPTCDKDEFDEGHLSHDPAAQQQELDRTMAIMEGTRSRVSRDEDELGYVFQSAWDRVKERSSEVTQQRYRDMHRGFFDGILKQVEHIHEQRVFTRNVDEYMDMRRRTIGVHPVIVLCECVLGIHIPSNVVTHPSLEELGELSADLVMLVNDLVSYKKDLEQGVDHNLIVLLTARGLSRQQAVDEIGSMLDARYRRWYAVLADMPIWGEEIDRQVIRYSEICRNIALGSLYWR